MNIQPATERHCTAKAELSVASGAVESKSPTTATLSEHATEADCSAFDVDQAGIRKCQINCSGAVIGQLGHAAGIIEKLMPILPVEALVTVNVEVCPRQVVDRTTVRRTGVVIHIPRERVAPVDRPGIGQRRIQLHI